MPDKPVTVAAYAAGASLAAITLFYVFGPTFFIDGENSYNTSDGRKRGIIGLVNPANDCFINSVLQALAGLGDLRLYLIRELHRRQLDGAELYEEIPGDLKKDQDPEKERTLQQGPVTKSLKQMLDALNERPIYKKTISARPFIESLERAFNTRVSRNQQDAQEFFQVVAERLDDEYHAAAKARTRASGVSQRTSREADSGPNPSKTIDGEAEERREVEKLDDGVMTEELRPNASEALDRDDGFPFESTLESQIRCMFCGFKNKPSSSTFVSLTLNVPQKSSTTLDNCFDVLLKTEDIDDFKCDKCRLNHALESKKRDLEKTESEKLQVELEGDIQLIQKALEEDPEKMPEGVKLPPLDQAPKRKIKKHTQIKNFPKILALHLSRSVFNPSSYSTKNMAKVSYPERLRLGGILDEKYYRLLGVVCHKGSHNSGHYESFRRNHLYPPFSTPETFRAYAAASRNGSVAPSVEPSPYIPAVSHIKEVPHSPSVSSTHSLSSTSLSPSLSRPSSRSTPELAQGAAPASTPRSTPTEEPRTSSQPESQRLSTQQPKSPAKSKLNVTVPVDTVSKFRRKKKSNDRWWRISDDKIKECKTSDVLAMQREVYLLFYELERPGDDAIS